MSRLVLLVALLAILSCSDPVGPPSSDHILPVTETGGFAPPSVATLVPGDRLIVSLHSTGCFHDYEADLSFLVSQEGHAVTARARTRYSPMTGRVQSRRLSPAEVNDLDKELALLRQPGEQGLCTTQTRYTLTLLRGGIPLTQERLKDEDCRTFRLFFGRPVSEHPSITFLGLASDALPDL